MVRRVTQPLGRWRVPLPPASPDEAPAREAALLGLLDDLGALVTAGSIEAILRAAVEAACRLTSSRRGLAALADEEEVVCDALFDTGEGWMRERLRWLRAAGGVGSVCDSLELLTAAEPGADGGERLAAVLGERFVALPLAVPGEPAVGVLAVGGRDAAFTVADAAALQALCRLAALRLRESADERRRSVESCAVQADIADRLQRRLLPPGPPHLDGVDVAFAYHSASAGVLSGGDFVDFYSRSPGTLAFAIGDVAGKGVDAMAIAFVTKYVLRAAVQGGQLSWPTNPGEALQELRTALLEQPDFREDAERFVTVLFGTLNTPRRLLQLASAGHPTPFIVRADCVERPLLLTEPAIGVELGAALSPYPSEVVELRRGDVLVLFTDGLTELRDAGGGFFEDHMAAVLDGCHDAPAADIVGRLISAGYAFSARPPADDMAVLCIHLTQDSAVH